MTLNNIGNVHVNQGNYAQALELLRQSLKFRRNSATWKAFPGYCPTSGTFNMRQGNIAQALGLYRQSIKISEELGNREGMRTC